MLKKDIQAGITLKNINRFLTAFFVLFLLPLLLTGTSARGAKKK